MEAGIGDRWGHDQGDAATSRPPVPPSTSSSSQWLPLPRAPLGVRPSPVELVTVAGRELWLKREDLNAPVMGGNKARALQFLLAGVDAETLVLTLGGVGSTHVLSTAFHAARLGARTRAVRWPHLLNPASSAIAAAIEGRCERAPVAPAPAALLRLAWWRAAARLSGTTVRYVPFGGSVPAGIAGQVEAALELAHQLHAARLPPPRRIVLPVGSGGTAAGLSVGLALAGLATEVVGVRVGPLIGVNRRRVLSLAARTRSWLRRTIGLDTPPPAPVHLLHDYYGGAYGRPLTAGGEAAAILRERSGITLDGSYGAKAAAAAMDLARGAEGPTLLWITCDAAAVHAIRADTSPTGIQEPPP